MKTTSPLTILLVEDHEDTRRAIKRWLEWKGWQVLTAGDQTSALAVGLKQDFDLLLCDLQLPDGNGWELMEKLKAAKPVRGIITSGHCSPSDIAHSKAVGYLEHLVKPYPVEELDALLERVQKQAARPGSRPPAAGARNRPRPRGN